MVTLYDDLPAGAVVNVSVAALHHLTDDSVDALKLSAGSFSYGLPIAEGPTQVKTHQIPLVSIVLDANGHISNTANYIRVIAIDVSAGPLRHFNFPHCCAAIGSSYDLIIAPSRAKSADSKF